MSSTRTGRGWAYLGALLGGVVSVAANVAHSYVPPGGLAAPGGWHPQSGAVVGAVFWPVALFCAVEILARVVWPHGRRWTAARYLGLLPVALVAAVVSYRHLSGLLAYYHEDALTARIGPLAVDGLMVMATSALIATGARRLALNTPTVAPTTRAEPVPEPAAVAPVVSVAEDTVTAPTVVPVRPARTAGQRRAAAPKRQPSAAERVARAKARHPQATAAQIAARLGLSERTVQRHMRAAAVDSVSTTPASAAA